MAFTWWALNKVGEEMNELGVELNKLAVFPQGKHPGRKRSLILSTEDECADVLAAVNYFIDRNKLDRKRIERRMKTKTKKFEGWWGKLIKDKITAPKPPKQVKFKKQPKKVRNAKA